jgi:hypothetical protein
MEGANAQPEAFYDTAEGQDVADQLMTAAIEASQRLREGICEVGLLNAIRQWVQDNRVGNVIPEETELGPAWPAQRIRLPPGAVANIALFSVHVPVQEDWPIGLSKPPVISDAPMYTMTADQTPDQVLKAMASDKWSLPGHPPQQVDVRISYEEHNPTLDLEAEAVSVMSTISKASMAHQLWLYTRGINGSLQLAASHTTVKKVLDGVDLSSLQGEHADAGRAISDAETGYVIVEGASGSGKSTLVRDIIGSLAKSDKEGIIVLIAPENCLLDEAVQKLKSSGLDVIRILPMAREVDALLERTKPSCFRNSSDRIPKPPFRVLDDRIPKQERGFSTHLNSDMGTVSSGLSPEKIPFSLTRATLSFGYQAIRQSLNDIEYDRPHSPTSLDLDSVEDEFRHELKEIACDVAKKARIWACTPVSFAQLMEKTRKAKILMMFFEEAGRWRESTIWLPISVCPDTPVIMVGNSMAIAHQDPASKQTQRQAGYFERMVSMGQVTFTLRSNYRAYGNVGVWAKEYFYPNDMNLARRHMSKEDSASMVSLKEKVFRQPLPQSNIMFANLPTTKDSSVGNTWVNPASAIFVVETAVFMFRAYYEAFGKKPTVLINTPYAGQRLEIEGRFARVKISEVDKSLFKFLTIDASANTHAKLVFTDLVRSQHTGFMTDLARNAVMATRAEIFHVIFGNRKALSKIMLAFFAFCQKRQSVVTVENPSFCFKCNMRGHNAKNCTVQLSCACCGQEHGLRNCSEPKAFPQEQIPWISPFKEYGTETAVSQQTTASKGGRRQRLRNKTRQDAKDKTKG